MKILIISAIGSSLYSILLLLFPLTRVPSYESSIAVNAFIVLFFAYLFPKLKKMSPIEDYISSVSSITLILFTIPLIFLTISGIIYGFCPGFDGLTFYVLLNAPLLLLLSSIAIIFYKLNIKPYMVLILYLIVILGSLSFNIYKIIMEPGVKFYSLLWGYFPGPIYDEDVTPDEHLLFTKILSILISIAIWLLFYKRNFYKVVLSVVLVLPIIILLNKIHGMDYTREKIILHLGSIYRTKNFDIVYPADQDWSSNIEKIALLHEFYYSELCSELAIDCDIKIRSYIFRSEEEKKELTGAGKTQIAKPWLNEIYLTPISITDSKLKHEISHIIVGNLTNSPIKLLGLLGGLIPNMAVIEGIAVALEPDIGVMTLYEKAAIMQKKGILPSFEHLFSASKFYAKSSSISYSTSGAFIKYLIQTYGIEKFKKILRSEKFIHVYGKSISEIEKDYRKFISNIYITPQKEYYSSIIYNSKSLIEKRCPHEIASIKKQIVSLNRKSNSLSSYELASQIADLCLADSELILEISRALINLKRFDEAEKLIYNNIDKAENAYFQNQMLDILSDIYIFKGDIRKGVSIVEEQLLKIPDSDAKRNFQLKRYLYERGHIELLKRFYSISKIPLSKVGILSDYISTENEPVAKYLFGRLLFNVMDYNNSLKYLADFVFNAINIKNIPENIVIEAANTILISSIYINNYTYSDEIIKLIDLYLNDLSAENDYHLRRYIHIRKFYKYIKEKMEN
ncbi:MAG: hypothetical protein N2746_06250 [Deltaproteobacteria bacterium]|nr:hypothetical protein [Deltaproteobacteria bacterium]